MSDGLLWFQDLQVIMAKLLDFLFFSSCVLIFSTVLVQGARQSQDIKCGACRALVDEMEWAIAQVDPKKMIQTGSFRINPDGSQSTKDVPFVRSEGHLLELMEGVCEKMKDYGESLDPATNRKTYVRFMAREGASEDVSNVSYDSRVSAGLKYACESIVEQNEDEIIEFFAHETDNVKDKLCSKRTDLCDHALKIPHDEL
ncbi:protein canopy-like 2 precursor [Silurus meridionalis]|nr:protein canopy-like 2 precursor [Silurus meridionalis]